MSTNNRSSFQASLLLFFVFVAVLASHAQSNTGTVLGTVQDDSGASVPYAAIVVKNLGTGEERTLKSDGNGAFDFSNLQVGHYSISITRDGFSPIQIRDVELQLAQRFTINPALHVGAVSDMIPCLQLSTGHDKLSSQERYTSKPCGNQLYSKDEVVPLISGQSSRFTLVPVAGAC